MSEESRRSGSSRSKKSGERKRDRDIEYFAEERKEEGGPSPLREIRRRVNEEEDTGATEDSVAVGASVREEEVESSDSEDSETGQTHLIARAIPIPDRMLATLAPITRQPARSDAGSRF